MVAEIPPPHALALILTTGWLITMAIHDVRTRTVSNQLILYAAANTVPLWILIDPMRWLTLTLPWAIGLTAMALLLWRTHTLGGADAKAMIWLAFSLQPFAILQGFPMPALLLSLPICLGLALLWQKLRTGTPCPFMVVLGPITLLAYWLSIAI